MTKLKRKTTGRGLFYHRDSGGKHDQTPAEYVRWANRRASELGVDFCGTPEQIESMIHRKEDHEGDLFLDYGVSGNILSRSGLDGLIEAANKNPDVSHIFVARRDRLARPDDFSDAIKVEDGLRKAGLTLVFMDKICPPLSTGGRRDVADFIASAIDYDNSGRFRLELAQKMIYSQLSLARQGYSVGGRAKYGFDRWLITESGTKVRKLSDGERVRMHGRHVVWLPVPDDDPRMITIRRILDMLETMPASRVARTLNLEGVPSPDAGRTKRIRGEVIEVSGLWSQSTIINIARNPLLQAVVSFGRRSMGDQQRFSPDGPRKLDNADFRSDDKPKVIQNPETNWIRAPATFDPLVDPERHGKLLQVLDKRAGSQKGKPRSTDPGRNPLSGRIFDMNCAWPMYRYPNEKSFRYKCGLYTQSHGAQCDHNHVDGIAATRFLLAATRQRILAPIFREKLEARIQQLAKLEMAESNHDSDGPRIRAQIKTVERDLDRVGRNMALAATPEQSRAMATEFDKLNQRQKDLEAELRRHENDRPRTRDLEAEVAVAMEVVQRLPTFADDDANLAAIGQLFTDLNVRMFCRFQPVRLKKRTVNRLTGGVAIFGNAPLPINPYDGPTARRRLKSREKTASGSVPDSALAPEDEGRPALEGKSLRNVSRGDKI